MPTRSASAQGLLGCYLRNQARAATEAGDSCDVEASAAHAVEFGCPELAEAAEIFMNGNCPSGKAGGVAPGQAKVGPITWGADDEPGQGVLHSAGLERPMPGY